MQVNILRTERLETGELRVAGSVATDERRYFWTLKGQELTLTHENGRRVPANHLAAIRAEIIMVCDSHVGDCADSFVPAPIEPAPVDAAPPIETAPVDAAPLSEPAPAPVDAAPSSFMGPQTLVAAYQEPHPVQGGPNPLRAIAHNYRVMRARYQPAHLALELARAMLADKRILPAPVRCINRAESDGTRWVADPSIMGLRLVGTAQEIRNNHCRTEAFPCDTNRDSFCHGLVFQIPARHGNPVFVAGHTDPWIDGPARIDFSELFTGVDPEQDKRDCAYQASQLAEKYAEKCFNCSVADQAGMTYSMLRDEIGELRSSLSDELRVRRCAMLWTAKTRHPRHDAIRARSRIGLAAWAYLTAKGIHLSQVYGHAQVRRYLRNDLRTKDSVDSILEQIREKRKTMESLMNGSSMSDYSWDSRDQTQREYFRNSAGLSV